MGTSTADACAQLAAACLPAAALRNRPTLLHPMRFPAPQKQRKRKSLEKALAVASRTETKVAKGSARKEGKKGLKKLWMNEGNDDK